MIARGFSTNSFLGDLRDKFYATDKVYGTPGTYTRASGGNTWTKSASSTSSQQYDPESDFKVFMKDGKSVVITEYAGSKQAVRIPPTIQRLPVTRIGESAFSFKNLASVTIPDGVTTIEGLTFFSCTSLTGVTVPNSVTSIGREAFSGCTSLVSVTIPNSVIGIGDRAFSDCTRLASVTIPDSVTSIGNWVFSECTSLTRVTFQGLIPSGRFSINYPFDGDLRDKYLAGGIGTYTRASGGDIWTKQ
jgi:hypothetical protein